jgi:glycosyltransferase involved in cell wall biosynthesis
MSSSENTELKTRISASISQPLVTAVLVCWNHEKYVEQSIRSVFEQTYQNIQMVVIDNGSTDSSLEIINRLRSIRDFEIVAQSNVGLVRALNTGLKLAKGKYFTVLATDDMWLSDKVKRQVEYFEENPDVHLVFGATKTIDANGQTYERVGKRGSFVGDVTFEKIMTVPHSTNGPTVMCRTETLRRVGGYDESIRVEDFPLVARLTYDGYRVVGLPEVLTLYRKHENNWSSTPLFDEKFKLGKKYQHTEQYKSFVKLYLRGYFRWLSSERKRDALRVLVSEPIDWTFRDVGIGLLKLSLPASLGNSLERYLAGSRRSRASQ